MQWMQWMRWMLQTLLAPPNVPMKTPVSVSTSMEASMPKLSLMWKQASIQMILSRPGSLLTQVL